jgi:hypothetical protein
MSHAKHKFHILPFVRHMIDKARENTAWTITPSTMLEHYFRRASGRGSEKASATRDPGCEAQQRQCEIWHGGSFDR